MVTDLARIEDLKVWLNITGAASDAVLARALTAGSQFLLNWLNRPIIYKSYVEKYNGNDAARLRLRAWPIVSVSAVSINGVAIPASPDGLQGGFIYDDKFLMLQPGLNAGAPLQVRGALWNTIFSKGMQNISVSYVAGFTQTDTLTVPNAPGQNIDVISYTLLSLKWNADVGVVYASSGAALTKVSGTPVAGQYSVDANGTYSFAAADVGAAVSITYGCVPADISQACIELVGAKFKARTRIGLNSETLAGQQTMSYSNKDLTEDTKLMLQNYRKVVPA